MEITEYVLIVVGIMNIWACYRLFDKRKKLQSAAWVSTGVVNLALVVDLGAFLVTSS